MLKNLKPILFKPVTLLVVYIIATVIVSIQLVSLGYNQHFANRMYTSYNNYVVFKHSFFHLLRGQNLYAWYPREQWDLYKYSPTFALFMGSLAYLPDLPGLCIWNLINALGLYAAIRMLLSNEKMQSFLLWFMLIELITSMQNAQSNGLMAALIIGAFACMQRGKLFWATLWLVIATFVKVYGAIGFCLFLFYPEKIKAALYAIMWTVIIALLPLIVIPLNTLVYEYRSWGEMMAMDQSTSYGLSVMGWLHTWFGVDKGKTAVSITGILFFFLPFVRWKLYKDEAYKILMLAFMLLWVIIFNHKAESPTYIIAMAGAGIWYVSTPRAAWKTVLVIFVFVVTCLTPTDLFPVQIRHNYFVRYTIKAVPSIILWVVTLVELMTMKQGEPATTARQWGQIKQPR